MIICGPPDDWCDPPSDLIICGPPEWCDHPSDVITWPICLTSYHEAVREKGDARDTVAQIKQGDHATWMGDHSTCFSEIRYGRANQTRRSRHMGDHSTCFNDIRDGSANQTRRSRHMGDNSTCFSEIRYGSVNQTRRSRRMGDHSTCFCWT